MRGTIVYKDEKNGIQAEVHLGGVKKQPKDYFKGTIRRLRTSLPTTQLSKPPKNQAVDQLNNYEDVCSISGTYLGYIEFDSQRYWDLRETQIQAVTGVPLTTGGSGVSVLPSDSRLRPDSQELCLGSIEQA